MTDHELSEAVEKLAEEVESAETMDLAQLSSVLRYLAGSMRRLERRVSWLEAERDKAGRLRRLGMKFTDHER